MQTEVDILENDILNNYPEVLDILLRDHNTQRNIFWATDNYKDLSAEHYFNSPILPKLITGINGQIIMPRVKKDKELQQARAREMAEVFTPSWICNAQNNLIDTAWFNRQNVFNKEVLSDNGSYKWMVNYKKVPFSKDKTWKHYVKDTRLEIACGEAPYITSRYDTTTGEFITVQNRIGILDRKLRVINENVDDTGGWLKAAQTAYKNTYAFEWQGDSLLLAREAMLYTFIENYVLKFGKEPLLKSIQYIAYIISWNVWQMDGLKFIVPNSCTPTIKIENNLFGLTKTPSLFCDGCAKNDNSIHTGKYCLIKDWDSKDTQTGKKGRKIRFIDLLKKL